jgi:Lon protease-like protein
VHVQAATQPVNVTLANFIRTFFPAEYETRRREQAALTLASPIQGQIASSEFTIPFFVLGGSFLFPGQPLHLHIFEPRYRLMMRRCMAGSRMFGLLGYLPSGVQDPNIQEVGTIALISSQQLLADGRSLIESRGTTRFQILGPIEEIDGYLAGRVRVIDDFAEEVTNEQGGLSQHAETAESNEAALDDVAKLASDVHSVLQHVFSSLPSSVLDEVESQYGRLPEATRSKELSYFAASIVPASDSEKMHMLSTTSTKERLQAVQALVHRLVAERMGPRQLRCSIM